MKLSPKSDNEGESLKSAVSGLFAVLSFILFLSLFAKGDDTVDWKCGICGKTTNQSVNGEVICSECEQKRKEKELMEKGDTVKCDADFKDWKMADMSELFWIHLGIYVQNPNQRSAEILCHALNWAAHADHGLCNSFHHALKWAGYPNIYKERLKYRNKNGKVTNNE